jgi:hypothetical protein
MEYALVDKTTNIVENVIVLTDLNAWTPPENMQLVELISGYGIGCTWDGASFIRPPEPVVEVNTDLNTTGSAPNVIN